jgi:DNA-binding GntR family transcriptional regulator
VSVLIYHECITTESLSAQAYERIRRSIIRLELAPGDVLREDALRERLDIGRTPIREALQRLARDQFVTVIPRRGMFVSSIDVDELSMLYETRAMLEPYAARLACLRGTPAHWDEMAAVIEGSLRAGVPPHDLLAVDRRCHEIIWDAAGNRFLTDTLDMLYAHSDRVWHMYLADVADTRHAVDEHIEVLELLRAGDPDACAAALEAHVRSFDDQVRAAVTRRLGSPLAG